jgi:UDPglucose--hexose-1-phosphate uridylyltransferase
MDNEIRQRIDTGNWVIMAPERLKGGELISDNNLLDKVSDYDCKCPFCPGNEDRFENIEIDRINKPETGDWTVKCLENKYQIFSNRVSSPEGNGEFEFDGIYRKYVRYGNHELVIESEKHNKTFGTMTHDEVTNVFEMYYKRYRALNNNKNLQTVIFKNHGVKSGASQKHPHSQIVSMMVVPKYIRELINEAIDYFDSNGLCVFCKVVEHEMNEGIRIVYQNDKFIAICPYASNVPYEVDIYPKKHQGSFEIMPGEDINELSDCVRTVMGKIYKALSNPDFNIIFRNPPYHLSNVLYYHWHMKIVPYLITPGGFELGSSMRVNVLSPENAAEILRNTE